MNRKCLNVFAMTLLAGSSLAVSANADDGFSNRGTQNRQQVGQPQASRQGQDPRAFEGRQQHAVPTQAQLDEMRAKLAAQGLDRATIDQRMAQMQQQHAGGGQPAGRPALTQAQLDEMRAKMKAQGVDSATIEQRIKQMQQQHAAGGRQLGGRPALTQAQLDGVRAQLRTQGLDSATIEQRIAQMQQQQSIQHGAGGFQGARSGGNQTPQSQDAGARSASQGVDRAPAPTNQNRNFGQGVR